MTELLHLAYAATDACIRSPGMMCVSAFIVGVILAGMGTAIITTAWVGVLLIKEFRRFK